ncbi:MAG: GAF domain-containing sensor histidine kinase [Anaerolineae bacterium]|jgi:signal transduction histidine kinase
MDPRDELLEQRITTLERRIAYLERIVKVSQILNSTLSLEPLLRIIIQSATELTHTEACSIMLLDKRTGELRFTHSIGEGSEGLRDMTVPLDNSIAGWIVRKRKPLLIRDAKNDSRWNPQIDRTIDFDTRSILGVPLKVKDEVIGVMELLNKVGEQGFVQDDIQIANTLAAQAAIAIENARLLDELQQAYDELAELDQLKSNFVSIASHELRTPLSVILGYASFLREEVSGEAGEQIDIVLQSAMRLRSIIDDMVNLRHVDTGQAQLERDIFSMTVLISDVAGEFDQLAKAKQQILRVDLPEDQLKIDADWQKIYLVLANLLSNAIKFTPSQGRVQVSAQRKGEELWISVMDTGIGIPERDYDRIFDRFYQVEPSLTRRYEGMGLGLSVAKSMVELHSGRIWVESVVGKGSRFTVVLPISPFKAVPVAKIASTS